MKLFKRLFILSSLSLLSLSAMAAGDLSIDNAWIRQAPPGMHMLAGYMTIHNRGAMEHKLVAATSPAFGHIELHRSVISNGVAEMIPQKFMPVPAHGELKIAPGGYHLMLMMPKKTFTLGEMVPFELHFADGEVMKVMATVKSGR